MSRWFIDYRNKWILEHIENKYFISRNVLVDKFDISPAQATRDIARVRKENPDLLQYETSFKKYITPDYWVTVALSNYAKHKELSK